VSGSVSATNRVRTVGLAGAGYISSYHAAAVARLSGVRVASVCDRDPVRAQALAERCCGAAVYDTLDAMLAGEHLDAVHVLVPADLHLYIGRRCLEAGVDVLLEKPMAIHASEARILCERAKTLGRRLGVSHNFLFLPVYEQLLALVRSGCLGRLREVEIVWNKELPQARFGPFASWLLADAGNVVMETGAHSVAHALHLLDGVGELDGLAARAGDPIELPTGVTFFRRFEVSGDAGSTRVSLRFCFAPGYPEHRIHVRGSFAAATVDFERNLLGMRRHGPYMLDLDRFFATVREARSARRQALVTLARFVLEKVGWGPAGNPFPESIERCVAAFHAPGPLDPRLSPELGSRVVATAELSIAAAGLPATRLPKPRPPGDAVVVRSEPPVLVIGGTGFIGRELIRQLRGAGRPVRVLAREGGGRSAALEELGVEVVGGDLADPHSVRRALEGVVGVVHLARGQGSSWDEMRRTDLEPTRRVAAACLETGVKRLVYASSIAVYDAGRRGESIDESTPLARDLGARNPYVRAKVESEDLLLRLRREKGLPVVIVRPGIVIGAGASPMHWGIGEWCYEGVVRVWGAGGSPLPFVLVSDVAAAMVAVLRIEGIDGESYNLIGDVRLTAHEYLDALERVTGVRIERVSTPLWRFHAEALAKWSIKRAAGRREPRPRYRDAASRSSISHFDASKARAGLCWQPVRDRETFVREGIEIPASESLR